MDIVPDTLDGRVRAFLPEGRTMRVYAAEDAAALVCPAPLSGTVEDAQAFVDRVTRSAWWFRHAPSQLHTPRTGRKLVVRLSTGGGSYHDPGRSVRYRGRQVPYLVIGTRDYPDRTERLPHIADRWVLLHEVAHAMIPGVSGHGREYAAMFLALVRRWLGDEAGKALLAGYRAAGVKYLPKRGTR